YEARAELALRTTPANALNLDNADADTPRSASLIFGDPLQETLANVLRTDQLAWRVILDQKLYQAPGFAPQFSARFPSFRPESPSPEAQTWLLERFHKGLYVRTVPRTVVLEMRFRSRDPKLSADVLNSLI